MALFGITLMLLLRGSLPQLDGARSLEGLGAQVVVERDDRGIPRITAASRSDLVRATGFLHAQDRYFQMDLLRRSAAGELAALFGASAVAADEYLRIHRFRALAQQVAEALEAPERELLVAYTEGVNAGLDALKTRPFEYWILRAAPEPWRVEDSVLVLLAMFLDLQEERDQTDATREAIRQALPPAMARLLLAQGGPWDAPLAGGPLPTPPLPTSEEMAAPGRPEDLFEGGEVEAIREHGSNAFAIAASRSSHGGAILASDMHLNLRVPNIWYPVRWEWGVRDASSSALGLTLPGAPALVIGSNGHVAWGFTNSYVDGVDLIELIDADESGFRGVDGRVDFDVFDETIAVKGGASIPLKVRWTEFGPVISDHPPRALQWTAHEVEAVNLGLIRMLDVFDLESGLVVLHESGIPTQNVVLAAVDGRVAWTLCGRLPRRAFDGRFTVRSDDPRARWSGFHPPSATPSIVAPASESIWSANGRTVCCEELEMVGDNGYSLAARASQIRDAVLDMRDADESQMLALQLDDRAIFLTRWRELLVRQLDSSGAAADQIARIRDDSDRASVESTGYGLVRRFRLEVHRRVLDAWTAAAAGIAGFDRASLLPQVEEAVWRAVSEKPAHLLPEAYESWEALLADAWSSVENVPRWGDRNRLEMRHPLSSAIPILARWLDMPADELAGDSRMPRVQGPGFGASERFVVSPGREEEALFHMPGGVSGHPLSRFYRAGHEDWVRGRPTRFLGHELRHRLKLEPAN